MNQNSTRKADLLNKACIDNYKKIFHPEPRDHVQVIDLPNGRTMIKITLSSK